MSRIGILGGTFDPPHCAHLAMARTARERIPLDRVLVTPAPHPPHKDPAPTPYPLRKEMAKLAFEGMDGVEVSDLEEFRDGPSYTVELLEHLAAAQDDDLYLIIGADSLADMAGWREPSRILELATIVVFPRSGFSQVLPVSGPASVILFESPVIDVSSTEIRREIRRGQHGADVPDRVRQFILDNSLYC